MFVSIIIVSYNTKDLLINCIDSIFSNTFNIKFEIIVVDNDSKDGSVQEISTKFENIRLIALKENLGFGKANNVGINVAKGDLVFLLNPDTIIINNVIYELAQFLHTHEKCAVVGPNLLNEDLTEQPSFSNFYPSLSYEILKLIGFFSLIKTKTFNLSHNYIVTKRVVGAAMMIRKDVLDQLGAFNEQFFMYAEEDELCFRIDKAGYLICNLPNFPIIHLDGKSFTFKEERMKRQLSGLRTFYKICYSPFYISLLKLTEKLTIKSRLFVSKIKKDEKQSEYWKFLDKNARW